MSQIFDHLAKSFTPIDTLLRNSANNGDYTNLTKALANNAKLTEDNLGFDCSYYCAINNHTDCFKALIEHNQSFKNKILNNQNLLFKLLSLENNICLDLLLLYKPENILQIPNNEDLTALMYCAKRSYNQNALKLIKSNVNINQTNKYQQNALHIACQNSNHHMVEILIYYGIDINIQDIYGNSPLHYAATSYMEQISNCLLKFGANPNSLNNEGKNSLMLALEKGNGRNIDVLIDNTNLLINDKNNNSIMHYAAKRNNDQITSKIQAKLDYQTLNQIPVSQKANNKMCL